ncbi:MAG: response regulator transcription factor [Mangrovibacterium sp.]
MDEIIFIIHPSSIVRRGLSGIIQEFFKMEITLLNHVDELPPFCQIEGKTVLLLMQEGEAIPVDLESRFNQNNQVCKIFLENPAIQPTIDLEFKIHLNADILQIQQVIQLARNSANKTKVTISANSEELTQREIDVLKKIALGLANKEIADTLNISIHTVISHRKNITEKLNIKSISGLTVYAIMNKLLDISEINPEELV